MPSPALTALSPLDGRYREKVARLAEHFSEFGLIRYRVRVEIEWLKALAGAGLDEITPLSPATIKELDRVAQDFSLTDGETVKTIEARTNHDVKAIEYWLREKLSANSEVAGVTRFIHFACTSEDINNLCHALMLKDSRAQVLLPAIDALIEKLVGIAHATAELPCCPAPMDNPRRPAHWARKWRIWRIGCAGSAHGSIACP